jgi:hypothetical protein
VAKKQTRYSRMVAKRDAAGLCRLCGVKPRAPGKTRCGTCSSDVSAKNARALTQRFDSGRCAVCINRRVEGRVLCAACAEAQRAYLKRKRSTPAGRLHGLVLGAKQRAKARGLAFDLDVAALLPIPLVCPVLGIRLAFNGGRAKRNSPSLDRMKPALGYVRGNVRVISQRANALKSDATPDELAAVLRYVRSIEGKGG